MYFTYFTCVTSFVLDFSQNGGQRTKCYRGWSVYADAKVICLYALCISFMLAKKYGSLCIHIAVPP